MGFGGLLELKRRRLPRSLCYWLMTLLDVDRKVIQFPGGVEYPLDKNQVHWVLGTPCGQKRVPKEARNDEYMRAIESNRVKYDMGVGIPVVKVVDKVEGVCDLEDEYDFKTAFLIFALCDVLCPTTCRRLESDLVVGATCAMDVSSYDWSTLIVEKLLVHGRHFGEKFHKDGYAKGCGGCTYYLAILYLDRLNRPPMKWGMFPRCKAWSVGDVNIAKNDDETVKGDYGKIGCIDVAYGERHPLMARDSFGPQSMAYEIARIILSGLGVELQGGVGVRDMNETNVVAKSESDEEENIAQRRRRRGPRDNLNPYQRRMLRMGQGGVNAEVGGQKGERSGDVGDGGSEEHGYVGGKGVGGSEEEHENEEGDGQEEEEQGARVEEEEERQEEGERVEGQQEGERQEEEGERVEGREEEERQGEEGERVEGQQEGGERLEGQQEEGERVEGQQEGGERVEGQQEGERQEEEGERVEGLEEEERQEEEGERVEEEGERLEEGEKLEEEEEGQEEEGRHDEQKEEGQGARVEEEEGRQEEEEGQGARVE
ncbi:hypothetical protein BVRB_2g036480 [Beta vulgaris subsp. vulgaris]|nr:hypothetical protein BVRB_2g036480 [Beta vulgaris subsp. vulgaris]